MNQVFPVFVCGFHLLMICYLIRLEFMNHFSVIFSANSFAHLVDFFCVFLSFNRMNEWMTNVNIPFIHLMILSKKKILRHQRHQLHRVSPIRKIQSHPCSEFQSLFFIYHQPMFSYQSLFFWLKISIEKKANPNEKKTNCKTKIMIISKVHWKFQQLKAGFAELCYVLFSGRMTELFDYSCCCCSIGTVWHVPVYQKIF